MLWASKLRLPFHSCSAQRLLRLSSTFVLRPYQEDCLDACLTALNAGVRRIGVSLPTGAGKTAVFITLLSRLEGESEEAQRTLVIVNSVELATQTAAMAKRLRPDWTVEIEQGGKHAASGTANLTVATYQTLLRPQRLTKFEPAHLRAVVVDEAHHAAAPSYRRVLAHFNSNVKAPDEKDASDAQPSSETEVVEATPHDVPLFGFSATFSRHDGLALGSVFEQIVYHRDFLEMIKEQWLCHVLFTTVQAKLDLKGVVVSSKSGDFSATSLEHVINTETINKLVVQSWMDKAGDRKSTLVFCVNLAHVRDLTNTFRASGVDARYLHAGTPANERVELIRAFKQGEYPVLVNCAILTEGADIPNIDCVLLARPTRSRNVFAQMIGRGMRLSPETGKENCRIIDFVDVFDRMPGVVNTPTLFGLDPSEVVDGTSTEELQKRAAAPREYGVPDDIREAKSVTFIDHDDPFKLVNNAAGISSHVAKLSRNAWVGCGDDVYVLECLAEGHIRIEPVKSDKTKGTIYRAYFTPAMKLAFKIATKFAFNKKKHILDAETLADAVRGCDTYATRKVLNGPMVAGLLRSARWRQEPATAGQKTLIAKKWSVQKLHEKTGEGGFPDRINKLTKGEANNIISRLTHGALSRYSAKVKAQRKVAAAELKEQRRQAREDVNIGPLTRSL